VPATAPRRRARVLARARRAARAALRAGRSFRNSEPHALREAALVAAMSDRPERALDLVDRSIASATRLGARYQVALSREARAQLRVALERPGAAGELERASAELHALRAPVAEPVQVTVSLIDRFRAILDAGQRIARALAVEDVFEALRAGALALLPARRCSILEPPGQGREAADARVVHGDAAPVSSEMVAEALAGTTVVLPRGERPIAADATLARAGVRSALCAPVLARGRVAALLYVTSSDVSAAFGDAAEQMAEFLTALAGAALENAEGFLRVQQASRELEGRVVARTAELARANAELAASVKQLEDTQQQLLHAGRMAAVGTLIAGLSHELNNPLTVILGNIENLVRLMPAADDQQRRMAEAIDRQARRAARLVNALLRFSRTQPETREPVDPRDLVRTVADLVSAEARRRDIDLRVSLAEALPALAISQQDIESALVNITTNALQATPPRGRVEVEVGAEERAGASGIAFVVRDTGIGIEPELLPQIFDPFFTTKPAGEGTGLGLSLARQAVTAHGGHIDVESAPGQGTRMRLWLPLAPEDGA
jgi:signal transduction histidine kinase